MSRLGTIVVVIALAAACTGSGDTADATSTSSAPTTQPQPPRSTTTTTSFEGFDGWTCEVGATEADATSVTAEAEADVSVRLISGIGGVDLDAAAAAVACLLESSGVDTVVWRAGQVIHIDIGLDGLQGLVTDVENLLTVRRGTEFRPITAVASEASAEDLRALAQMVARLAELDEPPPPTVDAILQAAGAGTNDWAVRRDNVNPSLVYLLGPIAGDGTMFDHAVATFVGVPGWQIALTMTEEGADEFDALAAANLSRRVAIVFNGVVLSAPTFQSVDFGGEAVITGNFTQPEAWRIALQMASPFELVN